MTVRSRIGLALLRAVRPVGACIACGREFDAGTSYTGKRYGGPPRSCCSTPCRDRVALERRTTLRGHRSTWHDLAERHRIEDAGQLDLTGMTLPTVPAPPLPPTRTPLMDEQPLPLEAPV